MDRNFTYFSECTFWIELVLRLLQISFHIFNMHCFPSSRSCNMSNIFLSNVPWSFLYGSKPDWIGVCFHLCCSASFKTYTVATFQHLLSCSKCVPPNLFFLVIRLRWNRNWPIPWNHHLWRRYRFQDFNFFLSRSNLLFGKNMTHKHHSGNSELILVWIQRETLPRLFLCSKLRPWQIILGVFTRWCAGTVLGRM